MTLYTSPPESVCIDGMEIPINTDFRKWISFQKIFSAEKNDDQRNRMLCEFMYEQCILPSQQALDALVRFYVGPSSNNEKAVTQKHGKAFDFEQDSEFIYSAFYQTYGINLAAEKMHWWMFKEMCIRDRYPALLGTLSSRWIMSCSVVSTRRIVSIFVWAL